MSCRLCIHPARKGFYSTMGDRRGAHTTTLLGQAYGGRLNTLAGCRVRSTNYPMWEFVVADKNSHIAPSASCCIFSMEHCNLSGRTQNGRVLSAKCLPAMVLLYALDWASALLKPGYWDSFPISIVDPLAPCLYVLRLQRSGFSSVRNICSALIYTPGWNIKYVKASRS
jgi:hypothetical protein